MATTTHSPTASQLKLMPIDGPPIGSIIARPGEPATIGRSSSCQLRLLDPGVSRVHATLSHRNSTWFLADLASSQGTYLNGVRLKPEQPSPVRDGDLVIIAPWTFRVLVGRADRPVRAERPGSTLFLQDTPREMGRVEQVAPRGTAMLARQLDLLIECSASIQAASSEEELARAVLHAALEGSGFARAALLRHAAEAGDSSVPEMPQGAGVEVVGFQGPPGETPTASSFSRSLLRAAASGAVAKLTGQGPINAAHSVMSLGITQALCAPISVGPVVAAYLYLDARGHEAKAMDDPASFCQALARLAGLAMANLQGSMLRERQELLLRDLNAARQAQQLIMPPESGAIHDLRYAMRSRPGRLVAGDLFDVIALDDGRVAITIGDVMGEGAGAAIVMACAQAHLHAMLLRYGDPGRALTAVNTYLTARSNVSRFVSLWVGVFDPAGRVLTYADAGHGYALHRPRVGEPRRLESPDGQLVGLDSATEFTNAQAHIEPGDRVVLFSDGLVEQDSREGARFGVSRVMEVLAASASPDEDVELLLKTVLEFAGSSDLADDTTVASIEPIRGA